MAKDCCRGMWGYVFLLVGILFLLQDLHILDLQGISWWTIGFLLVGAYKVWGCN